MIALDWLLRRFIRTMVESSSRLSNVTGAVVKRDPRTLKLAQQRRQQRAETLSNVARNLVRMVVWSVALVMILSEVGVEIAPVIASLGVIGLAAGIGDQTIIKDFEIGRASCRERVEMSGGAGGVQHRENNDAGTSGAGE